VQEPSRLESVLMTCRIDSHCKDIRSLASQSYNKQAVLRAIVNAAPVADAAAAAADAGSAEVYADDA